MFSRSFLIAYRSTAAVNLRDDQGDSEAADSGAGASVRIFLLLLLTLDPDIAAQKNVLFLAANKFHDIISVK